VFRRSIEAKYKKAGTENYRLDKIKKRDGPSPGSYKHEDSITKTHWISIENKFRKWTPMNFAETYAK
jgi:hypothetical protein